jgi:hypothetical protein
VVGGEELKKMGTKQIIYDIDFFRKIKIEIRNHPDKYREAGKWLDEYCSVDKFWKRRESQLEDIKGYEQPFPLQPGELYGNKDGTGAMSPEDSEKEYQRELLIYEKTVEYLELMIKLKKGYYRINWLMDNWKKRPEYFTRDWLERSLERSGKVTEETRLDNAYDFLTADPARSLFIGLEKARRIILITWLLYDPDSENSGLNLTDFESWSWSKRLPSTKKFLACYKEKNWHTSAPDNEWMVLARIAWEEIQAAKEVKGEFKSNKEEPYELQSLPDTISQLLEILKRYGACDIYVENGNNEVIEGDEAANKNILKADALIAKALELAAKLPNKELARRTESILGSARDKIDYASTIYRIESAKGIEFWTDCVKTAFKNTYLSLNKNLTSLEGETRDFLISYYSSNGSNINLTDTGQEDKTAKKATKKKKSQPWKDANKALFVIDGNRIKFRYKGEDNDLRLKNGSKPHQLLFLFSGQNPLPRAEIKELCTQGTRPSDITKQTNAKLNEKIAAMGLADVPQKIEFIKFDRESGCYGLLPEIKHKDDTDTD